MIDQTVQQYINPASTIHEHPFSGAFIGGLNAGQLKPAARSAEPREARPPPKAAGAGGAPELREGRIRKLEATKFEAKRQQQSQTQIYLFRVRRHRPLMFLHTACLSMHLTRSGAKHSPLCRRFAI